MTFSREFRVPFGAVDQARVIYYPRFFDFFHRTFEEWFGDALGTSYAQLVLEEKLGFPSVRVETEFRRPVRYGERLRIDLELEAIGRRSITMRYTAVRLPDGEVSARATVKKAIVNQESFVSIDIPPQWRSRFEAFKEGS
jgi:4-hydroxybenzoyl-CoA thioesterase